MSEYVKMAAGAGELYLASLAEIQSNILKSVAAFTAWTPTTPSIPTLPLGELPTPLEVAEANFTFTEKLLKQQKAFTEKFFATGTPAKSGRGKS